MGTLLMQKHSKHDAAHFIIVTYGSCGARVRYWNRTVFVNIVYTYVPKAVKRIETKRNRRRPMRWKNCYKNTGDALAENFLNGGYIRLIRNIKRPKLSRWTATGRLHRYTCASRFRRFCTPLPSRVVSAFYRGQFQSGNLHATKNRFANNMR